MKIVQTDYSLGAYTLRHGIIVTTTTNESVRMNLENFIVFLLVVGRMAGLIAKHNATPEHQIGLNASARAGDVIANTEFTSDCEVEVPV